ncbi:Maspardin [Citrus sinensis]|uniref:Maspardin n=1 Tax=Citrus sinensis TaxID=2711 RepID=A0ACB8LVP6_CITSI|nr:Maspardin [Citrus sinensis]
MKGVFSAPGDFVHFKSQVPLHKIPIGTKQWRYYDFGPKVVPPLICLPGTAGTAEVYYKQIMALSMKGNAHYFSKVQDALIADEFVTKLWIQLKIVLCYRRKLVGYRVISVDIPRVWNHHEWIQAFEKFLDAIDVHHVRISFTAYASTASFSFCILFLVCFNKYHMMHEMPAYLDHKSMNEIYIGFTITYCERKVSHFIHLYGTSLGGFLAQLFAQHRPRRVRSLVLSNTFLDTHSFAAAMPWAPMYVVIFLHIDWGILFPDMPNLPNGGIASCSVSWTPSFLLKRYVLTGIHDGPHEPFIADSVDFVVCQVETLSREDLASRLTLTADSASVGNLLLSDSHITIMDTNDYCATPQQLKDQLSERYSGARQAYMKTGGDFPFLSRPDEVNLHLQLHLRRVGVEAQPDLVRGISRDGSGGDPSESNDRKEDSDNPPQDDEGNFESPSTESQLPAPESSEPHSLNELPLSTAKCCFAGQGDAVILLPFPLLREQITVSEILLQLTLVTLVPHLVGWINANYESYKKSSRILRIIRGKDE